MKNTKTEIHEVAKKLADSYRKAEKKYMDIVNPQIVNYKGPNTIKYSVINNKLIFIVKDDEGVFQYEHKEFEARIADLKKNSVPPQKQMGWIEV